MPPDTRLLDAAESILDNVAADLAVRGINVPTDRMFVTTGDVAHDFAGSRCADALIVTFNGLFQGLVGQGTGNLSNAPIKCSMPLVGQFTIALLRCVPVVKESGAAPTTAELQASGETLLLDAMTLPVSIVELQLDGALVAGADDVGITTVQPIGPLGGVGGVALTLIVTLL